MLRAPKKLKDLKMFHDRCLLESLIAKCDSGVKAAIVQSLQDRINKLSAQLGKKTEKDCK